MFIQQHRTHYFEDLACGMSASVQHLITADDIARFSSVSGDRNPMHLDPQFAASTRFKTCIAHGMLTASYISAVLGMVLPGPGAIYLSQNLNWRAPVRAGDEVTARVVVAELVPEKLRARFGCACLVGERTVLEGDALLMVPPRPGLAV